MPQSASNSPNTSNKADPTTTTRPANTVAAKGPSRLPTADDDDKTTVEKPSPVHAAATQATTSPQTVVMRVTITPTIYSTAHHAQPNILAPLPATPSAAVLTPSHFSLSHVYPLQSFTAKGPAEADAAKQAESGRNAKFGLDISLAVVGVLVFFFALLFIGPKLVSKCRKRKRSYESHPQQPIPDLLVDSSPQRDMKQMDDWEKFSQADEDAKELRMEGDLGRPISPYREQPEVWAGPRQAWQQPPQSVCRAHAH